MEGFDFLEDVAPPTPPTPPALPAEAPSARIPRKPPKPPAPPAASAAPVPDPKLPPHNLQAEEYLIGSMLVDPEPLRGAALSGLRVTDFYSPVHQTLAGVLIELVLESKEPSPIAVMELLHRKGQLDVVGGPLGIEKLANKAGTTAQWRNALEIVQRNAALREIWNNARRAAEMSLAGDLDGLAEILPKLSERQLTNFGRRRLPLMRDIRSITFENAPPLPDEVIKGVLHRGCKMVIGGGSKDKKTWALADLAVSVATGREWWGLDTVNGKVAYVNFEIIEPVFSRRVQRIEETKGVRCAPGMLSVWTLRGYTRPIAEIAEDLMRELEAGGYALIILDPIYKLFDGLDENKAGDVLVVMNRIEEVAVKTGAAIGFAAHFSKGNQAGKEAMDRIGGSGVFGRDPDAILTMTKHEEEGSLVIQSSLRNFESIDPFVISWKFPLFERDGALSPEAIKQPAAARRSSGGGSSGQDKPAKGRPAQYRMEDLLRYYPGSDETHASPGEVFREARADGFGAQQRALFYFHKEMLGHGWIEAESDHAKRYRRTKLGQSVIEQDNQT